MSLALCKQSMRDWQEIMLVQLKAAKMMAQTNTNHRAWLQPLLTAFKAVVSPVIEAGSKSSACFFGFSVRILIILMARIFHNIEGCSGDSTLKAGLCSHADSQPASYGALAADLEVTSMANKAVTPES